MHYTMLSDIFPTGWHATRLANLEPGQSIVIMGAGPVGLMAALSAKHSGRKHRSSSWTASKTALPWPAAVRRHAHQQHEPTRSATRSAN